MHRARLSAVSIPSGGRTKPPGEGTGLGLAVAKRIVDFHNGHMDVRSQHGVGTVFTVRLPAE